MLPESDNIPRLLFGQFLTCKRDKTVIDFVSFLVTNIEKCDIIKEPKEIVCFISDTAPHGAIYPKRC